jgi:NADH:ubiquinone oxidoreductase subunit 4 (subunit M)
MMYMSEGVESRRPNVSATAMAALALAMLAVLYLGVLPTRILDLARDSIATIL